MLAEIILKQSQMQKQKGITGKIPYHKVEPSPTQQPPRKAYKKRTRSASLKLSIMLGSASPILPARGSDEGMSAMMNLEATEQ
jgi:hypothetical protein